MEVRAQRADDLVFLHPYCKQRRDSPDNLHSVFPEEKKEK